MTTLAFIELFNGWWTELSLAKQFFYGIGLVAGLVSLLLMVLSLFGMDHDDAVDSLGGADGHDGDAGGVFSVKTLTGFFLGFGWAGGFALDSGQVLVVALVCAMVAGTAIMAVIVFMFRAILAMRSDGTARIADTVGAVGTVYVTLPAAKASGGQVVVNFRGRQETYLALCNADRPIPSGDKVKVLSVVDGRTVLVEPLA
ncbi:MAG: NfeD family protein [Opitutaceae bacterium]|nr:NfeD family protein [Opitutaceae bacterium]